MKRRFSSASNSSVVNFSIWVRLRWLAFCSVGVAQRQFSGEYGPLTFMRSMLCLGVGLRPISLRKFGYEVLHRSQISIPRPPYSEYLVLLGLQHLCTIPPQVLYSGINFPLTASPWVSPRLQPQDLESPLRKLLPYTIVDFPQSHLHNQWIFSCFPTRLASAYFKTISLPNRWPVMSRGAGI